MRCLVTRAEPEAEETASRLRALGHEAILAPLSRIAFCAPPVLPAIPDAIVATSRNAVRALGGWPSFARLRGVAFFAVGAATGEEAKAAGLADIRVGGGDAAALGGLVGKTLKPGQTILYVAARDRAGDLEAQFDRAGLKVVLVEAYRAETVADLPHEAAAALRSGAIDGILFHSRRNAEAFRRLAERAGLAGRFGNVTFYAISARVAAPLAGLGPAGVAVAARPDDRSLLALLPKPEGWPGRQSPV